MDKTKQSVSSFAQCCWILCLALPDDFPDKKKPKYKIIIWGEGGWMLTLK